MHNKNLPPILLVVEDSNKKNQLGSRLRVLGYTVEVAMSGFHTIHLVEKNNYSLLLIVDSMSDMSPIEITSLIRNQKMAETFPIIYVADTKSNLSLSIEVLNAGANVILESSSKFQPIIDSIKKLLNETG